MGSNPTPSASGFAFSLLLAFVDDDIPAEAGPALQRAVREMAASHDWTIQPPELVDQLEDGAHTLGAVLTLHAPESDDGRRLPVELDRRLLADARRFVEGITDVARELNVVIGFELDQDSVGWIENGEPDRSLRVGLLEEWARVLDEG